MQFVLFFSAALFALLLFIVYTKQHVQPWGNSPLLYLLIVGTLVLIVMKKKQVDPFSSDSVAKQIGQIEQIKDLIQSKVTLNQDALDQLEARITETTDNISTLQANMGVSQEAQKYA